MLFFSCFPGAKGVIVGAVVVSIAALAVAAGIFVFLVWKSRKRNSKNSNGKSSTLPTLAHNRNHVVSSNQEQFVFIVASFKSKASLKISKQF